MQYSCAHTISTRDPPKWFTSPPRLTNPQVEKPQL